MATCKDSICKGDPEIMRAGKCTECGIYQAEQRHQTSEADVTLNNLLSAIKEINGICEETAELSDVHTPEEAIGCDQALSDILKICEDIIAENK